MQYWEQVQDMLKKIKKEKYLLREWHMFSAAHTTHVKA